jgi:hypothetical protein
LAGDRRLPRADDGLELLREAVDRDLVVELTVVDGAGRTSTRLVRPRQVSDGTVRGVDPVSDQAVAVPIPRVSAVRRSDQQK